MKREKVPINPKNAIGNCYEAAWDYLIVHDNPNMTMVYGWGLGSAPNEGKLVHHAWIEIPGVFIEVSNDKDGFRRDNPYLLQAEYANKEIEVQYIFTRPMAIEMYKKTNTKGPWSESDLERVLGWKRKK